MRTLLLATMLATVLPRALAQDNADPMRVTVNVGAERLKSLLTDEQKQSVTHLTVTGTLQEEDYAYLRAGLLGQLAELNLRDADIDTIPAHAFDCELFLPPRDAKTILPVRLKHIADYGLHVRANYTFVLTGKYPTLGNNVYGNTHDSFVDIVLSEDNDRYKHYDEGIYSLDGDTLFRTTYGSIGIRDGVRVIYSNAFENGFIYSTGSIPATVDSIGDRAFANVIDMGIWGEGNPIPYLLCLAAIPPRLGKDVFLNCSQQTVYVPDESIDLYMEAEGWKDMKFLGLSTSRPYSGIKNVRESAGLSVTDNGDTYVLQANKSIKHIRLYNAKGQTMANNTVSSERFDIPKSRISSPVTIVRVNYADGTSETLKLRL